CLPFPTRRRPLPLAGRGEGLVARALEQRTFTMCGIAGLWKADGESEQTLIEWGEGMNRSLRHRGPDDSGLWVDAAAGLVLAHRRLAIIDLSPRGHQPMTSRCTRYVIAFNGEIYNFLDVRRDLEKAGLSFRSNSDTEVLVDACAFWGVEPTLDRLNGMFAFALWDRRERRLTLARDRMGKKPLYYGWHRNTLLFGSELKALCSHSGFPREIDHGSLALFLRLGYVPAPHSIYRDVYKLPAGHFLELSALHDRPSSKPYWSPKTAVERGGRKPFR